MMIVGVDYHPSDQYVAFADAETGEYRTALINAFRARGIRPEGVLSYGEDSLAWDTFQGTRTEYVNPDFGKLWNDLNRYENEPDRENEQ